MTRVALTVLLPLLLPTALYVLWLLSTGGAEAVSGAPAWRALPWPWLVLAGVGLAAAVLVAVVEIGGQRTGTYVPPHVEDGRIVPGHVVSASPAPR